MQRISFLYALLLSSSIISLSSCKKESAEPPVESNVKILSKSGWRLSKDEVQTNSGPITDLMTDRPACRKDDITVFKTDNSMEINEGATKCDALHPQIISISSWGFSDNETKLQMGGGFTYSIEKLDNSNFILFYSYSNGSSVSKRRLTYIR